MARAKHNVQCRVCRHPDREKIERLMVSPSGPTLGELAETYGLSIQGLSRHRTQHLTRALATLLESGKSPDVSTLMTDLKVTVERFRKGWDVVETLMTDAVAQQNAKLALMAAGKFVMMGREFRRTLELLGKATGELKSDGEGGGAIVVVIPALVPVGTPADLRVAIPAGVTPEGTKQDEGEMLDAEFEEIPPGDTPKA